MKYRVSQLPSSRFQGPLYYKPSKVIDTAYPIWPSLSHLFKPYINIYYNQFYKKQKIIINIYYS